MSDPLRVIPLGVGDAFSAKHYTSCLAVGVDDQWILIDCPHPIRKMLREGTANCDSVGSLDLDRILAVAITHLHADHCCGIEDFGYYTYYVLGRRAKLLAHSAVSARMWNNLLAAGMEQVDEGPDRPAARMTFDQYFDLTMLSDSAITTVGPFSIECRRTMHSVPTTAFKIRAAGRTLGMSSDTPYDPSLIAWLSDADLIIHEATSLKESNVHTPYHKLASLPTELIKRMRITHYPDDFVVTDSLIEPLVQGRSYTV